MIIAVTLDDLSNTLGGQRRLRRSARAFAARHGVPVLLRRRSLTRWTYPLGRHRCVEINANTATTRSFLTELSELTARGARSATAHVHHALERLLRVESGPAAGPSSDPQFDI